MLRLPPVEQSYWRQSYTASLYPQLNEDLSVDVAVVGGGITGLSTAYLLAAAGLKVAVLEKRTLGAGTTGRTTGKVTAQHNLIYKELIERFGMKLATAYGQANLAAVDLVKAIVKKEKIDCEFQPDDNYVYSSQQQTVSDLRQEAKAAQHLGLPASFVTNCPLPFKISGAVKFSDQAKFNSQKYLLGLASAITARGGQVFENSPVIRIRDGSPARLTTKLASITAEHIVVATNVPTWPLIARGTYCLMEYPTESYIVAGKLTKPFSGMYISPDKDNYSILPFVSGDQTIVLIGGANNIAGVRRSKTSHYRKLADYAEQHFGLQSINYCWNDRDYLAYDKRPLIGKLYPWSKQLYVGTAYMKWGLSNGTVAAMLLKDALLGKHNEWSSAFNSIRISPLLSIPSVMLQQIKS